jgi:hypothetical protein
MAVITVPSSVQGKSYSVRIAGNAPTPEEQARISEYVARMDSMAAPQPVAAPEESSMLGEIGSGLGRGFFGSLAAVPGGLGALAEAGYGKVTGQPITPGSTAFGGILQDISEEGRQAVEGAFGPSTDTTSGKIGEAVGSIGSFLIPGGVVGGGARLLGAGARAAGALGTAAGAGMGASLGADQQAQEIGDAILNGDVVDPDAQQSAILWGGIIGTSEMVAGGAASKLVGTTYKLLNKVPPSMKEEAIATISGRIRSALTTGGIEGAQEALSQIAQNVVSREYYDEGRKLTEGAGESFGVGGAAGAIIDLALTSARAPAVRRGIQQRQQAEEAKAFSDMQEDQEEDAKDIMAKIGFGKKSMEAPVEEIKPLTSNLLPSPEARPVADSASPVVTTQPTAEAPLPVLEERPAPTFRWKQYQSAVQNIGKAKAPTILAIQKAAEAAGTGPVTPAVARDIRSQMERDGVIKPSAKVKGGYEYQPNVTPQVDRAESYRRTIEDITREAQDARTAREKALQDARRAEQTGKKADARKFMLEVDKADQAIAAADRTVQEVSAQMPMAQQQQAVPTVQRPGSLMEGKQKFVPITEAPPAAQARAVTSRDQRLRQAMSYYQDQAKRQGVELRRLQDAQKKVQLPKSDIKRMEDLKASIGDAARNVQQIGQRLANPTADIEENAAQQRAAAAKEAAAQAERANKTPIYGQKEGEIFTALRKRLNGMGLKDVQLVAEKVIRPEAAQQGGVYEGLFDVKDGNRVIAVSMGIYDPSLSAKEQIDALGEVVDHEVIHAMLNLGLFTDAEWKTLTDLAARQQYMKAKGGKVVQRNYTYLQRAKQMYASETPEIQVEEAIAEMFRDYVAGRLKIGGRPKTLMERIKSFFTSIWKSHEDVGMTDPNQIFDGVRFGEIGGRERKAGNRVSPVSPNQRASMLMVEGEYDPSLVDSVERSGRSRAITNMQPNGDTTDRISTRQPSTKRATENPLTQNLVVDLAAMEQNPKAFAHNMQLLKSYVGFRTDSEDPKAIAEDFIRFVEANLNWLYSNVPQEIRDRSKLWYKGARRITENWSGQYGVPDFTVAGVLAALSPQKDWYQNVSLAERVLDIHTHFTSGNNVAFMPDAQMAETAARIYGGAQYAEALKKVLSTPYADLRQEEHQAMWLRIYDEAYNPRGYRIVSSEGDFIGKPQGKAAWGSNVEIAKAIYALKHQDRDATSEAMGEKHKVRNFYNNILAPDAPHGDVTIDTHAVAAALIRPLSGSSPEVHHNFGSSPSKAKQPVGWSAAKDVGDTGASGTYGIYAEAYRRAADKLGILPRELQSITWEAIRGLFPAVDKRNKGKVQRVNEEWAKVSAGTQTEAEARENISNIMGGVDAPTWYGLSDPGSNRRGPSSYEGELAISRLDRQFRGISGTDVGDADGVGRTSGRGGASSGGVSSRRSGTADRSPPRRAARFSLLTAGAGDGGRGETVRGLAPLEGAPQVRGASGPDMRLVRVAEDYARSIGIDLRRQAYYAKVDPDRATRIAEAYEAMPHAPNDPKVKEAYQNLIDQTTAQYRALEDAGYKFWFMDPENVGEYGSSPWNAMRDIRANQSMGVYPTTGGFGTNEEADISGNPMLAETGIMWPFGSPDGTKVPVLANDLFRAVHDAFGHGLEGAGFRADGEENAWQAHIRLFTGSAKGAITSETRGQNSWLNYGPYGEANKNAKVEDTVFADQKTGIMPEWTWEEGRVPDAEAYPAARASVRYSTTAITPAVGRKVLSNQSALMYAKSSDLIAKALNLGGYGMEERKAREFSDGILRRFQDSMMPINRMVQELSQAGLTITDAMDTVLQESLMHGVVGQKVTENQKTMFQPLLDAVKGLNVPKARIDALVTASNVASAKGRGFVGLALERYDSPRLALAEAFLYARHAKERNRFVEANRDIANQNGSGMTDEEADVILNWFRGLDDANKGLLAKIGQQARMIVENTNRTRVDAGLISPEVAGLDGETVEGANFKYYVPLRGKFGEDADDAFTGPPSNPLFGAKGKEDQKMLGRFDYGTDLIANLFTQNQNSILRGERNKVGQSFLKLLRADPKMTSSYASILDRAPTMRTSVDGKIREVPDPRAAQDPDILIVKEDGKQTWVRFTDLGMAGAMNGRNGMSPASSNVMLNAMQTLNRYLSTINTSYNPEFIITNGFRDLQTGLLNMNQFELDGVVGEVIGGLKGAALGIRSVVRKDSDTTEWAKVYKDYMAAGGQNVTNEFNTLSDQMNNIQSTLGDISEAGMSGKWAKVKNGFVGKGVGSMISLIEDYNTIVENAIRLSAYKALLDRGFTKQRAAQAARNLTVNFAKGGDYRQFMGAWSLFYNASLQGSFALLNAAVRSPKVRKLWLGIIAAGIAQDQLNALLSDEDEDGEKVYDKIPDYILERNFILPDFLNLTDRSYISIPMPYGLNMAHNLGRATSAALRGARDPGETSMQIVMNVLDTVNPLGGTESFFNLVAPTVADPLVDIVENKDFSGRDIYKEGLPFDKTPQPDSQMYWSTTSPSAVWISNMLNEMTGGNEVRPGFIDWSPDVLEYWFSFATGGIGRFAQSSVEAPMTVMSEGVTEENVRQLPLVRRLLGSVSSREDTGVYMEGAKRVLMAAEELKRARETGDADWARETMQTYGQELRLIGPVKSIETALRKISMQRNKINDNPNIPEDQRRLLLDRLDERKQMILSQGNKLLSSLE